jgi:hypothetical protein
MVYIKVGFFAVKNLRLPKPYISTVVAVYDFMRPLFATKFPFKPNKRMEKITDYLVLYK